MWEQTKQSEELRRVWKVQRGESGSRRWEVSMGLHGGEEQLWEMGEKPRGCGEVTWRRCTEAGQGTLQWSSSVPGVAAGLGRVPMAFSSMGHYHCLPVHAIRPGLLLEGGCLRLRRYLLHII